MQYTDTVSQDPKFKMFHKWDNLSVSVLERQEI